MLQKETGKCLVSDASIFGAAIVSFNGMSFNGVSFNGVVSIVSLDIIALEGELTLDTAFLEKTKVFVIITSERPGQILLTSLRLSTGYH